MNSTCCACKVSFFVFPVTSSCPRICVYIHTYRCCIEFLKLIFFGLVAVFPCSGVGLLALILEIANLAKIWLRKITFENELRKIWAVVSRIKLSKCKLLGIIQSTCLKLRYVTTLDTSKTHCFTHKSYCRRCAFSLASTFGSLKTASLCPQNWDDRYTDGYFTHEHDGSDNRSYQSCHGRVSLFASPSMHASSSKSGYYTNK